MTDAEAIAIHDQIQKARKSVKCLFEAMQNGEKLSFDLHIIDLNENLDLVYKMSKAELPKNLVEKTYANS